MKKVTTGQWISFWFWISLGVFGGICAIPSLVASWKNPTSTVWALVAGGLLAGYVVYNEFKKIGLLEINPYTQPKEQENRP